MIIGGLQKFSLIDYPGKSSAIIFTQGCNFRCHYCHNPELVLKEQYSQPIPEEKIFAFLKNRQGQLDAVSITGGEPTLHQDLINFIKKIKKLGFLIKLDTNGTRSRILKKIIDQQLVDYLAMDIKAPLEKYEAIVDQPVATAKLKTSIKLIIKSGIDYEFRTTVVKSLLSKQDLLKIAQTISGANQFFLQRFEAGDKMINSTLTADDTYSVSELKKIAAKLTQYVDQCRVR